MNQLLPYETIVKASEGDPEAVAAVLSHYAGYIRSCAKMDGQINTDMQEHIVRQLIETPNVPCTVCWRLQRCVLTVCGTEIERRKKNVFV